MLHHYIYSFMELYLSKSILTDLGFAFYKFYLLLGQGNIVDLHLGDLPFEVAVMVNPHSHSHIVLRG